MNSTTLQNKLLCCIYSQFYRHFVAIVYQSFHLCMVSFPHAYQIISLLYVMPEWKALAKTVSWGFFQLIYSFILFDHQCSFPDLAL